MTSPDTEYASLTEFYRVAWDQLGRGVADAKHPARTPTLATISANGFPTQRTVVLRAADRLTSQVEVHTDSLTPKVEELRENNKAALHVWIRKSMLQLRLEVCFDVLTGLEVADRWNAVPPTSRISYGTKPVPGKAITVMLIEATDAGARSDIPAWATQTGNELIDSAEDGDVLKFYIRKK